MATRIQLRNGTAAQWTSANPTLAIGELGVETDTNKFKVGNGTTAWNSLAYTVGFTWRGAWSGLTAYVANDFVSYGNAGYIAIQSGTNQTPATATAYWNLVVTGGGLAIGGSSSQVQYNSGGILAGSSNLVWDNTNGRLGIGTASPLSRLQIGDIAQNSVQNDLYLVGDRTNASGYFSRLMFKNSTQSGGSSANIRGERDITNFGTLLSFYTQSASAAGDGSERVRIDSNGTVMIGTTSADSGVTKLLIYDYADAKSVVKISGFGGNSSSTGTYALNVEQNCDANGGGSAALYVKHTNFYGGSPASMVTFYGGYGGIAGKVFDMGSAGGLTLNIPNTGLSTIMTFQHGGSSKGTITVSSGGTAYNTSSDRRLKDNIASLTSSGAFIDSLQPRTWDWQADGSSGVGFIADEVAAVSPGTVHGKADEVDSNGDPVYQVMEYGSAEFMANIIAELQSLRIRVAQLEAQRGTP
jgi:hypothetical protein